MHHIWTNATDNWAYFMDDGDRRTWIGLLEQVADHYGWTVLAFCQMTTHVHAIVAVPDTTLPRGMQYLNREYSKRFNTRHDRSGHFVRKRFGSRRITSGTRSSRRVRLRRSKSREGRDVPEGRGLAVE